MHKPFSSADDSKLLQATKYKLQCDLLNIFLFLTKKDEFISRLSFLTNTGKAIQ